MSGRCLFSALSACLLLGGISPVPAREPAPGIAIHGPVDLDRLLQTTRLRESMTARLFYSYTFRQTTTEEEFAPDGSVKRRSTRVYDVVPTLQGIERHLVSKDGRDPTPAEQRKQDRRNESLQRRLAKMRERAERDAERSAAQQGAPQPRVAQAQTAQEKGPQALAPPAATATPVPRALPAQQASPASNSAAGATPPASPDAALTGPDSAPAPMPSALGPGPAPPTGSGLSASLAPLPDCDFENLLAAVRPPLPGSITRAKAPGIGASDQARRKRERASDYSLFELLNLTDHELAGACSWEGRPMHVVAFKPPETFDPLNPVERVMAAMSGSILIDAGDLEVARAEGATVAPITWGAGMVKLKAARVLLEYGRVKEEVWLPRLEEFEVDTRVLLSHERTRITHQLDDFRKAEVGVEVEYGGLVEDEEQPSRP